MVASLSVNVVPSRLISVILLNDFEIPSVSGRGASNGRGFGSSSVYFMKLSTDT